MPDSVVTSSKVTAASQAPGGLQISTVQDTNNVSLEQLIQIFGTYNVSKISRGVTTTINDIVTTQQVTQLRVRTEVSSSTFLGRPVTNIIPVIERISEHEFDRGTIYSLYTASQGSSISANITGSSRIVINPERRLSTDVDIRNLYLVSASEAYSGSIERTVEPEELEQHIGLYETKITQLETITASILTTTVHGYPQATDSISNPFDYDYDQEQNLYVFDSSLYTDSRHITPFQGQHTYYKLKNQDQAIGVTSKGQVFHWYTHGEKSKPRIRLVLRMNGVTDKLEDACLDPDGPPSFKNVWYVDGNLYEDDLLTRQFPSNGTDYIKNIIWDEVHRINQSGFILESQPC